MCIVGRDNESMSWHTGISIRAVLFRSGQDVLKGAALLLKYVDILPSKTRTKESEGYPSRVAGQKHGFSGGFHRLSAIFDKPGLEKLSHFVPQQGNSNPPGISLHFQSTYE